LFRTLTEKDRRACAELERYCFSLEDAYMSRPPFSVKKMEEFLGWFEGDRLVAAGQVIPFQVYIRETLIPAGGVASVVTDPGYRRKGFMRKFIIRTLEEMHQRGIPLSILWPAEYYFYQPLGWEQVSEVRRWEWEFKDMYELEKPTGSFVWLPLTVESICQMLPIYRQVAKRNNLFVEQNEAEYFNYLQLYVEAPIQIIGYLDKEGELRGYMRFSNHRRERMMEVYEIFAPDNEAERAFFWFIHTHNAQFKKVRLHSPGDAPYFLYLRNPQVECLVRAGIMLRLVDIKEALLRRPYNILDKELSLTLHIKDELAPWNETEMNFLFAEGKCTETRKKQAVLSTTIQTLAQLYTSFITFQKAQEYNLIHFSSPVDVQALDELFALPRPYCLHWF
jgi:predicted acetyltransferase